MMGSVAGGGFRGDFMEMEEVRRFGGGSDNGGFGDGLD